MACGKPAVFDKSKTVVKQKVYFLKGSGESFLCVGKS